MTTEAARDYLEQARWPNGVMCPACDSLNTYRRSINTRPGWHRCLKCLYDFSVRSGTIMEHSRVPLEKWVEVLDWWGRTDNVPANIRGLVRTTMLSRSAIARILGKIQLAFKSNKQMTLVPGNAWLHRILSYRPPPRSAAGKRRLRERKQREFAALRAEAQGMSG